MSPPVGVFCPSSSAWSLPPALNDTSTFGGSRPYCLKSVACSSTTRCTSSEARFDVMPEISASSAATATGCGICHPAPRAPSRASSPPARAARGDRLRPRPPGALLAERRLLPLRRLDRHLVDLVGLHVGEDLLLLLL